MFVFVDCVLIPNIGSTLNGKNLFQEEQILSFLELTPMQKGGKNENERVVSPGSVLIHLTAHITKLQNQIEILGQFIRYTNTVYSALTCSASKFGILEQI